ERRLEQLVQVMLSRRGVLAGGAAAAAFVAAAPAIGRKLTNIEYIKQIHRKLICLDTHLDTPARFPWPGWDIMQRHTAPLSQVDYPRMVEGGLDGGFWAIYTAQGPLTPEGMMAARDAALLRAAAIREMVAAHPGKF